MRKFDTISNLLRARILNGDYATSGVPSDRQLAEEYGISYMTARRAVQTLIDDALLARTSNGRAMPVGRRHDPSRPAQVAFLVPTFSSRFVNTWRIALEACGESRGAFVRTMVYQHWDEPVFYEAMNAFDGVVICPTAAPISERLISTIQKSPCPVAFVEEDFSELGIPSVQIMPFSFIQRLLDHLEEYGHQRIACLNTQPYQPITEGRIAQWRIWMAAHGYKAPLIDEPVQVNSDPMPKAYEAMRRTLELGTFDSTAILCITDAAAFGCMRALRNVGLEPGKDVAVATIGTAGMGEYMNPSLTALESCDPTPYLSVIVDWIISGSSWKGSLLLRPYEPNLVIRESSGDPVRSGTRPLVSLNGFK
ncbi:MAG: substrate-binding domain-containing protein [Capsulimonadaceae bacterium]|nr:substrate-binding domain-containing protein [Capsulimonadaceae bacterium]